MSKPSQFKRYTMAMKTPQVIVGLSGGVDSSVAALLLKQQGLRVSGVFMKNWEEDDQGGDCPSARDIADAKAVCDRLDIPFHTVNFSREYWDKVFEHFLTEYRLGLTPNPDILCNREIKFGAFLDYARQIGAEAIATGHYVRKMSEGNEIQLLVGLDPDHDQSYFLWALNQEQLRMSHFPVGVYKKSLVREMAKTAGFPNHNRKGSTGICFIGERRFKPFLSRYLKGVPGPIETPEGKRLGQHEGLMFYTIGQRSGLKIGGQKGSKGVPWYVAEKNLKRNALIVVEGLDHPLLFKSSLIVKENHWVAEKKPDLPLRCTARIRYRQPVASCMVTSAAPSHLKVQFDTPERAVTPGQSIVFYQGEACLGGGVIVE